MHDDHDPIIDEDPLGPVATVRKVSFGVRQAALAGVGRGLAEDQSDYLSEEMLTWHITCSGATLISRVAYCNEQSDS